MIHNPLLTLAPSPGYEESGFPASNEAFFWYKGSRVRVKHSQARICWKPISSDSCCGQRLNQKSEQACPSCQQTEGHHPSCVCLHAEGEHGGTLHAYLCAPIRMHILLTLLPPCADIYMRSIPSRVKHTYNINSLRIFPLNPTPPLTLFPTTMPVRLYAWM